MSVIVWDGRILAADRMATTSGWPWEVEKLTIRGDICYGITGYPTMLEPLVAWHANEGPWPKAQDTSQWSRLLVLRRGGELRWLEDVENGWINSPQKFVAFGAGRDFALGALWNGADAIEAVMAANALCDSCGFGVTYYDSETHRLHRKV